MFSLVFDSFLDLLIGFKYFLKATLATVLILLIEMGLQDFDSVLFLVVSVIGAFLLIKFFIHEFIGKTILTEKVINILNSLTIVGIIAFLSYKFDIDFFKENFAEFTKEFVDMIETGRGILYIIFR